MMIQTIENRSITFYFGIQRTFLGDLQEFLRVVQIQTQTKGQLNDLISGWFARSIEKLVPIRALDGCLPDDLLRHLPRCFTKI